MESKFKEVSNDDTSDNDASRKYASASINLKNSILPQSESLSFPPTPKIQHKSLHSRTMSDSRVPTPTKDLNDGAHYLNQLRELHTARMQLLADDPSQAAQRRRKTWMSTLEEVHEIIGSILQASANAHLEESEVDQQRPLSEPGLNRMQSARRATAADADFLHDEVNHRISRQLREPIVAMDEQRSRRGIPLRVETALDAYSRGEYSTGQPEEEYLPPGLRPVSSPMKHCHNGFQESSRPDGDSKPAALRIRSSTTHENARLLQHDQSQSRTHPTFRRPVRGDRSFIHPVFRKPIPEQHDQSHIHPAYRKPIPGRSDEPHIHLALPKSTTQHEEQSRIHQTALGTPNGPRPRLFLNTSSNDDNDTDHDHDSDDNDENDDSFSTPTSSTLSPSRPTSHIRYTPFPPTRRQSIPIHHHHVSPLKPPRTTTANTTTTTPNNNNTSTTTFAATTNKTAAPALNPKSSLKPHRPAPLLPLEAATPQEHQSALLDALLGVEKGCPTSLFQMQSQASQLPDFLIHGSNVVRKGEHQDGDHDGDDATAAAAAAAADTSGRLVKMTVMMMMMRRFSARSRSRSRAKSLNGRCHGGGGGDGGDRRHLRLGGGADGQTSPKASHEGEEDGGVETDGEGAEKPSKKPRKITRKRGFLKKTAKASVTQEEVDKALKEGLRLFGLDGA